MLTLLVDAQKNKARIENQRLRDTMDPFLIPSDRFVERYRMPPFLVQQLIADISPFVRDDNEQEVPLHLRVLATLSFYASGCYQRKVGMDAFCMLSQSTVSKCIREISRVITNELGHKYIRFPQNQEEVDQIKTRFVDDYGVEGVLGLVDGTNIRVSGLPSNKRNAYIGRKGFTSINTQFVIDSDMRILNVNARYPGSTHDTFIWLNSKIFTLLEKKFNLEDQNNNSYRNTFLLGDSGYPLQPWLMIPFKENEFTSNEIHEKNYNKKQRKIRNKIERFNAVLKNTWRCINGERALRYSHEQAGHIIYATSVLHNFLVDNSFDIQYVITPFVERNSDSTAESDGDDEDEDEVYYNRRQNEYLSRGRAVRNQLIARYF